MKKNILLNIWYAGAIITAAIFAYRDGASMDAIIFGALGAVLIVCFVLFAIVLWKHFSK